MALNGQHERKPNLMITITSVREGRTGLPVGQWFEGFANDHGEFDVTVADLAEIDLPLMTEPNHPSMKQYTQQHTWDWSERVEAADAFVFVMPEYNYSVSAPLVNALDYLYQEWQYKPVGLVSYGGVSGGLRAAQHVKPIVTTLKMHPLSEGVAIPKVASFIDEDSHTFTPNESVESSATTMLDALVQWESALREMRAPAMAGVR